MAFSIALQKLSLLLLKVRERHRLARHLQLLAKSRLFSSDWYLNQNPGPILSGNDPILHYLQKGAKEGRNPGPDFDGNWYLERYPDVRAAGQNPLIHYLEHGALEGREIRPVTRGEFDSIRSDEFAARVQLISESSLFDPDWYLRENPDVAAANEDPAIHYLAFGAGEGRNPGPGFDGSWYLECNTDVAAAGLNPLVHYLEAGAAEGREIRRAIPANAVEKKLEARFCELKPLRTFLIPSVARRLTIVLNGVDLKCAGSGNRIAVILGALLAQHMGASLRFAMPVLPDASMLTNLWRINGITWSDEIEFVSTAFDSGRGLGVSENDFFLTTSWQTTRLVRSSVNPCRIIYLVQDDERMAYPSGDDRLRCHEILTDPELLYMVLSEMLFEHLTNGPTPIETIRRRGVWFERAIPIEPYPSSWRHSSAKRSFFFDARQSSLGSLYWRGLEVIRGAMEEGLFRGSDWDFNFISNFTDDLVLPRDIRPRIMTTLQDDECTNLLTHVDVGLCLADTPYFCYPIPELTANGAIVVTNRRRTKASPALYSDNILCADPSIDSLERTIGHAIRLAGDDEMRSSNYFRQQIRRDWTTALEAAVDRIIFLAGIAPLQRC